MKSPSNRQRDLLEKASLCLTNGTIEFWVVDRDAKSITVIQRDGSRQTFVEGESLPLAAFGGDSLDIAEIFA